MGSRFPDGREAMEDRVQLTLTQCGIYQKVMLAGG